MKIYIQWTTNPASGWIKYDHKDWSNILFKPAPVGGEIIDDTPGWIFRLNVQGVIFGGDHISMWEEEGKLRVSLINNDRDDFSLNDMLKVDFSFDTVLENKTNSMYTRTRQSRSLEKGFNNETFKFPQNSIVGHGIWVNQNLYNDHNSFKPSGWRDWIGETF
jgi:hypothetical protein